MMAESLRDKLISSIDKTEFSPPVEADSFERYTFEAKPFGSFPSWNSQHKNPNSEVKPDERED